MKPAILPAAAGLTLALFSTLFADAGVNAVFIGAANAPTSLGPWGVTPANDDARSIPGDVTDVVLIGSLAADFNQTVAHTEVGADWGSWSVGYAGDVYYTTLSSDPYSLTLDLGPGVRAIYLYAQPDAFDLVAVTVTASDGSQSVSLTESVDGFGGAAGFGFYADPGSLVRTISVSIDSNSGAGGFAVGKFGVVPEPSTWAAAVALAGVVASVVARRARRA